MFVKLRLAALVVMSAAICFILASESVDLTKLFFLILGGFLVTASSNGFNQIIERDLDKLMTRTANRPLPTGRMSLTEAYSISVITGITGIAILWIFMNPLSGLLGTLALFLYVAVYTPLKQKTPFAVFVGAFPGAIPPLLGWIAATNNIQTVQPWILFGVQFIWQFPHFWSISWLGHHDYMKAGFKITPSLTPLPTNKTGFQAFIYSLFLLPVLFLCAYTGILELFSLSIAFVFTLLYIVLSYKLFINNNKKAAMSLLFFSFLYIPVLLGVFLIDKFN
jgi:protoheme IX farnesyltransferase